MPLRSLLPICSPPSSRGPWFGFGGFRPSGAGRRGANWLLVVPNFCSPGCSRAWVLVRAPKSFTRRGFRHPELGASARRRLCGVALGFGLVGSRWMHRAWVPQDIGTPLCHQHGPHITAARGTNVKPEMSLGSRARRSSSAVGPWHRVRNAACAPLLKHPSPFVTFTEFPSPSPSSPRLCWLLGALKSPSPRGPAWGGHGAAPRPLVFCRGSLAVLSRSRSCGHARAGQQRAEVAEPRRVDVSRNPDSSKYFKAD